MRPTRADRIQCLLVVILSFLAVSLVPSGHAQTVPAVSSNAATPQQLAQLVLQRFSTGTLTEFESVDPDPGGRAVVAAAIQRKAVRKPNLGRVLWSDSQHAVLLLTGTVVNEDSAIETIRSRHFSGLYEAVKAGDNWSISRQLPFDADNHILSHTIDAVITPGRRIDVKDTVKIVVGSQYGFAVRLNDQAQIRDVRMNGKPVKYEFGGGGVVDENSAQAQRPAFPGLLAGRISSGPQRPCQGYTQHKWNAGLWILCK